MRFRLFHRFEDVAGAAAQPAARDFYAVLSQLREAAKSKTPEWATYPAFVDYSSICFWAVRKLEYSFAAESVAALERESSAPLDVLDVGCGVVPFCNWVSRRGHRVTAIDPLEDEIKFLTANDLNGFYNSRVEYRIGLAEQLDFADESFDLVTCVSVLEHIPPGNDRVALWEMARVLKPGGRLIITFDVAPPPEPQAGQRPWPSHLRRYAHPFSPIVAGRLLASIADGFETSASDLPPELLSLSWDDVHTFWRAASSHDERTDPVREYVATGSVLERRPGPLTVRAKDVTAAYLEGQRALEERVEFFSRHAEERMALLKRLDEVGQTLRVEVEKKEQAVEELSTAAQEKEHVIAELSSVAEERKNLIVALHSAAAELNEIGQTLRVEVEEKEQAIEELSSAAQEKERVIAELSTVAMERENLIVTLNSASAELDGAGQTLRVEVEDKEQAMEELSSAAQAKEQVIAELSTVAEERQNLIIALQSTATERLMVVEEMRTQAVLQQERVAALESLLKQQTDALDRLATAVSDTRAAARKDAEAVLDAETLRLRRDKELAEAAAAARLAVIEEQQRALEHYRFWSWREQMRRSLSPKLGLLYQYAPRPLDIPGRYLRLPSLSENAPKLSIVTPSLNQGEFIERTIKSVLGQGYPHLEYIVQDAVSNDETPLILERYSDRLAHVDSRPDTGFANGINLGFSHAAGEVMAYLNSDDVLLPGTLHYVAAYFATHPEVDVVYGHRVVIDEYDAEIGRWVLPAHEDDVLSWADFVPQETLFWRRRIWEKSGSAIDESFRFAIDWDLLIRFRDAGARIQRLPRFLGGFRVHPHQKTSSSLQDLGAREMTLLRSRAHGRDVTEAELNRALGPYLRKHIIYDKLYRLGLLPY